MLLHRKSYAFATMLNIKQLQMGIFAEVYPIVYVEQNNTFFPK